MRIILSTLITVAITSSFFLTSLAGAQTLPEGPNLKPCECKNLHDLKAELKLAKWLKEKFENEIKVLKPMQREEAFKTYYAFVKAVKKDPKRPQVSSDSDAIEFDLRDIAQDSLHKYSAEEQCRMHPNLLRELKNLKVSCKSIADALIAHEFAHQKVCIKVGGSGNYLARHYAAVAADEVAAYTVQMKVLQDEIDRLKKKCDIAIRVDVGATQDVTNAASSLHSEWTYTGVATAKPEIPLRFSDDGSVNGENPANVRVVFRQDMKLPNLDPNLCITEGHGQITIKIVGTLDEQGLLHMKINTSGSVPVTQTCTGKKINRTSSEVWPLEGSLIPPPDIVIAGETGAKQTVDVVLGMRFSGTVEVIPHEETEPAALSFRNLPDSSKISLMPQRAGLPVSAYSSYQRDW